MIIVICLIGMIIGSVFGIFFSGEDSGTGMSMQTVVQEINTEYDTKLQDEKTSVSYDVLEMSGQPCRLERGACGIFGQSQYRSG